jgi:hypothetical protein
VRAYTPECHAIGVLTGETPCQRISIRAVAPMQTAVHKKKTPAFRPGFCNKK